MEKRGRIYFCILYPQSEKLLAKFWNLQGSQTQSPGLSEVLSILFTILKAFSSPLLSEALFPVSTATPSTTFRDESCPGSRTAPLWLMSLALECPRLMRLSLWRQVFLLPPTWFLLKNHPLQTLPFISFWMFQTLSNTSFSYTFFCNKEEGPDIVFLSAVLLLQESSKLFNVVLKLIPFLLYHMYGWLFRRSQYWLCFSYLFTYKPHHLIFWHNFLQVLSYKGPYHERHTVTVNSGAAKNICC